MDTKSPFSVTFGMVGCFTFIFIFLTAFGLFIFGRSFLCFQSLHAIKRAYSPALPIIFLTDLQQQLKIEASLQNHQPQTKTATVGCQNRLSSNHIGSQMRPKCPVSGQNNAQYPFQFTFISHFNIMFNNKGTLI
jgi:hypothetical protein